MRLPAGAPRLVGMTGLEPAASWSQTKHSTKLSYIPFCSTVMRCFYGAPDRTRICALGSRSPLFYPTKLQAQILHFCTTIIDYTIFCSVLQHFISEHFVNSLLRKCFLK